MPLDIIRADITTLDTDAIVCPTNRHLRAGSGVDRAIRKKCGREIDNALSRFGICEVGKALYIDGCSLPCKYIIYTVGPKWRGGNSLEEEKLREAYMSSLSVASSLNLKSVAIPLISAGYYNFPRELALRIASDTITSFLEENEMNVLLVVYDDKSFRISNELFNDVKEYIDTNLETVHMEEICLSDERFFSQEFGEEKIRYQRSTVPLEEILRIEKDESFSEMVMRKIREKGITEVECYKKANIDRKLFSKIRSNSDYRASKSTALALALSLELEWPELVEMVSKAGYSMSKSNAGDIIIRYFVERGEYSVITINETLFAYDQVLLGQTRQE